MSNSKMSTQTRHIDGIDGIDGIDELLTAFVRMTRPPDSMIPQHRPDVRM
jgi:hypothetical protein